MPQRWSLNETQSELAQVEHPLLTFSVRKSTTTTIISFICMTITKCYNIAKAT